MSIATVPTIAGWRIAEPRGEAFGLVARGRSGNLMAGLRSRGDDEITGYTHPFERACRGAIARLAADAATVGADAVVPMRSDSSEIARIVTEIVAHGAAVVAVPGSHPSPPSDAGVTV